MLVMLAMACAEALALRWLAPEEVPVVGACATPDEATTVWRDDDGDGHGDALHAARGCLPAVGWAGVDDDCDDAQADVYGGAPELCNARDDDCDGAVDEAPEQIWCKDRDDDGYGDPADGIHACEQPSSYAEDCSDCDDDDATVGGGCDRGDTG